MANLGTDTSVLLSFEWATEAYYTSNGNTYLHETTPEPVSLPVSLPRAFHFNLSGLSPGTTYHYRAKAVGSIVYGNDMSFTTAGEAGEAGVGDGGACFIATAAYGSYLDSHVQTLRDFRDTYMVTNPIGRAFVSAYYRLSPPIAEFIDDHPALKPVVRVGLLPAVAMGTVAVSTTLVEKMAIASSLAFVCILVFVGLRRKIIRGKF